MSSKQNIFKVVYGNENSENRNKKNACNICGKEIATEYNLKVHEEACKKKNNKKICPICKKSKNIASFEIHVIACTKKKEKNQKKKEDYKVKKEEEALKKEEELLKQKKVYLPQILTNFILFILKAVISYNKHVDIYNYVDHPGKVNFYYIGEEEGKPEELSTQKVFEYLSAIGQNRPSNEYFKSMEGLEIREFLNRMMYYGLTSEKKMQIGLIISEKKLENIKKSEVELMPDDVLGQAIIEIMNFSPGNKLKISPTQVLREAFKQLGSIIMSNQFFLRPNSQEEKLRVFNRFKSYLPELEAIIKKNYPEDITLDEIKSQGDIIKEKVNKIWDNDHCGQYAFGFFVGTIISYFHDGGRNNYMCHFCCNYFMRPENHFFKYQCPDLKATVATYGFNSLLQAIQKQFEFMGLYKDAYEAVEVAKQFETLKPHAVLKKVHSWMKGEKVEKPIIKPKPKPTNTEKKLSDAQEVIEDVRTWYEEGWFYGPYKYNVQDGIYLVDDDEFNGIKLLEKISKLEGQDRINYNNSKKTPHKFIRDLYEIQPEVPMEVEEDIKEEKPIKKKLEKGKTIVGHKKFEEDNQISSSQEIKVLSDLPADVILVNKTDDEGEKKTKPKQENVSDQLLPETIETGKILYKKKEEKKHKFFGNDVQLITRIDRNTLIKQIAGYNKYLIWGKIQEKGVLKELELLMNAYNKGKDYSREALTLYTAVFGDITQTSPDIINLKNEIRQLKADAKKYTQQQITTQNVEMVKGLKAMVEIAESELKKKSEEMLNLESLAREEELKQKTALIKKIIDLKTWLLRGEREETGEGKSESELRVYLESLQEREHREILNMAILGYQYF